MIQSGRLRHRVTIQEPTETRDAIGDAVATWSTYAKRWAAVEPINGREFFAAQQLQSEVNTRVRLRSDKLTRDITAKMRVSWDSRLFDIQTVIRPQERQTEVILMCVERGL